MEIGMIGLGKMGANMVERLLARVIASPVMIAMPAPCSASPKKAQLRPIRSTRSCNRSRRRALFGSWCPQAIQSIKPSMRSSRS